MVFKVKSTPISMHFLYMHYTSTISINKCFTLHLKLNATKHNPGTTQYIVTKAKAALNTKYRLKFSDKPLHKSVLFQYLNFGNLNVKIRHRKRFCSINQRLKQTRHR